MLDLSIIVSVMDTCPKIASPRPPVECRQLPRLAIEANKLPIRGLMALMALLAHLKLALLRLFTIPSVSHRELVRLVRLVRTFLQAPLEASVPRDNCLMIAFQPFTRPHPAGMSSEDVRRVCGGKESRTSGAKESA
jgi:hypothetical protein